MRAARIAFAIAACFACAAQAEIYTWRDAGGVKQMSNVAPAWYSPTEPSRVRTQVLVNGHLVDDTGLKSEEREKLQAGRAKAENWGRRQVEPVAATPASKPVPATPVAAPTSPGATPLGNIPVQSLEGLQRALAAQKQGDAVLEQLNAANRPR